MYFAAVPKYGPWSPWLECTAPESCGNGTKLRSRRCKLGSDGSGCDHLGPAWEDAPCKMNECEYIFCLKNS